MHRLALPALTAVSLLAAAPAHAGSWDPKPYIKPNLGFTLYGDGTTNASAVGLGAQAGFTYFNSEDLGVPMAGRTRVSGTYQLVTSGGPGGGHDIRLGTFMGPQFKLASAELGLDVFHNGITLGNYQLDNAVGLDIPLNVTLGPQQIYALAGITPTLVFDPDRHVNWKAVDAFGFGHEFEWRVGAALNAGPIGLGLTYTRRVIAPNVVTQGFALGVSAG